MNIIENNIIHVSQEDIQAHPERVLARYKTRINNLVRAFTSRLPLHIKVNETEDLVSEVKVAFFKLLKSWDPKKGPLWSYAYPRLKGVMKDYLRIRRKDPMPGGPDLFSSEAKIHLAFNKQVYFEKDAEASIAVTDAMSVLDQKEKQVINYYYKNGIVFKQIGKKMGLSESQTSRIEKRAIGKMRLVCSSIC